VSATAPAQRAIGPDRLAWLVNAERWVLDLCFIRPDRVAPTFESMMGQLDALPAARFVHDTQVLHGAVPTVLGRRDAQVKDSVLTILTEYWHTCFARYWPDYRRVLEADVAYRARRLAFDGAAPALGEIDQRFVLRDDDLTMPVRYSAPYQRDICAGGLVMMPTLFKWNPNWPNDMSLPMTLNYRARGLGTMHHRAATEASHLIGVLGRVRTELLLCLDQPASSTALGLALGVTTSAANQHLRTLHRAGLLDAHRVGRYVMYQRSELGDRLVLG
ncbi:MAG: helix-turn-helix domain-containing protein, partial [Micrococcales bacterium]|nr:helix-turn-helix domain-containing protein [Micrococcales bacterium]